jgi:tetratricopeptide (TPR) repeat protein
VPASESGGEDPFASPSEPSQFGSTPDAGSGGFGEPSAQTDFDSAFAPPEPGTPLIDDATAVTPKREVEETDLAPKEAAPPAHDMGQPPFQQDAADVSFDFVDSRPPPPPPPPPPPRHVPAPAGDSPELLDFVDEQPKPAPAAKPGRSAPPVIAPVAAQPKKAADKGRDKKRRPAAAPSKSFGFRKFVLIVGLLAIGAVVTLGLRAGSTPDGVFWSNRFLPASGGRHSAATAAVIATAQAKLAQGTFSSAREALGSAAQLLASASGDSDAQAFFVLCASEMKIWYGQGGADWDQAKRTMDRMKGNAVAQNRARGAYALATGDVSKSRQILSPLSETDTESAWLFSQVLMRVGEVQRAGQVLDRALKGSAANSPKLLIARGIAAKAQRALPEASSFFEKALAVMPDHGRALAELADVKLMQNETHPAAQLLDKALAPEARKTLDASEEARASMLRGKLFVAQHQSKDAEIAFERAVQLDPGSAEVHAEYGAFRLNRREYDKAQRQLESSLQADPSNARVLADVARAYLGITRLVDADKRIHDALTKDPNDPHVLLVQGQVAEAIGRQEDAYKAYDKALQKQPDLADAMIAQGMIWVSRGDKKKARERLDAALKLPVRTAREEEATGDLALQLDDGKAGKQCYERAQRLDPEDPQAHSGLGRALAALGDLPGARAELEAALRQVDTDPLLHYEYGSLLRRIGDSQGAVSALQRAVQLDSKDYRYHSRLGALLVERREFDKAEPELRQARLANDKYGEAQYFLGRALAGQGKLGEAVDVMRQAVDLEPENAEFLYWMGLIYEQGQQVADAVSSLQKAVKYNQKNPDAYEHLGRNLVIANQFLEAVSAFKKCAELDPSRARIWAEIADAQQSAGDLDGAIASYQKSLAQEPNQPGVWSKLGIAYKDRGCQACKTRAIEALRRAELVDPKDPIAHHELGYLYKDDGKRSEAIAEFRKYLSLRPDAGDADTVRDDIYYLTEETRRSP